MSVTQTINSWIGNISYPPENKKYGKDAYCWMCGGDTNNIGWIKNRAINKTFTDLTNVENPYSNTVCQSCVLLMQSNGWIKYVEQKDSNLKKYFPIKEGKNLRPLNWLYMSHIISPLLHITPSKEEIKRYLIKPPKTPFVFLISTSQKKQLLFKTVISYSRENYPILLEDKLIIVNKDIIKKIFIDFENLYNIGLSKKSILSGVYNQNTLLKIGLDKWKPLEENMASWRKNNNQMLQVVTHCAQKNLS